MDELERFREALRCISEGDYLMDEAPQRIATEALAGPTRASNDEELLAECRDAIAQLDERFPNDGILLARLDQRLGK